MNLTIMTYNIQHGHVHQSEPSRIDLTAAGDVIRQAGADIVGLNEVRGLGEDPEYTAQAEFLAAYLGMHGWFGRSIYVGGHNPYGNAVLSRFPIIEARVYHIPDTTVYERERIPTGKRPEPRSILRAVTELPDLTRLAVYVSHFGLSAVEQEHAVSYVLRILETEALPFVLMGDFNTVPGDPVLGPLDDKLNTVHAMLGETKTYPSHAPEVRIDHFYASRAVRIRSAEVIPALASDHRPVKIEVSVGG